MAAGAKGQKVTRSASASTGKTRVVKKKEEEKEKKELKVGLIRKGSAAKKTGKDQGKTVEKKVPAKKSVTIVKKVAAKSPAKQSKKEAAKGVEKVEKKGGKNLKSPKKRSKIDEESEAGPSTGKRTKKGQEEVAKQEEDEKKELLAKIETIAAENEQMKISIASFEETHAKNKKDQENLSAEMKSKKEEVGKITSNLKAKKRELKDCEKKKVQLQSSTRMANVRAKNLERVNARLKQLMDQKDVQAARYGRKALTLRTENRKMKRYLLTLRTAIERVAAGRRTSFIERLLEMADEDFDPAEEQRRVREEMRARRNPNTIFVLSM